MLKIVKIVFEGCRSGFSSNKHLNSLFGESGPSSHFTGAEELLETHSQCRTAVTDARPGDSFKQDLILQHFVVCCSSAQFRNNETRLTHEYLHLR